MSIRVPLTSLSLSNSKLVKELLTLQPDVKDSRYPSAKTQFPFYVIEEESIYLPFTFAKSIGLEPVQEPQHQAITSVFSGTLRAYQEEPALKMLRYLQKNGAVTLTPPPGSGKTVLGCYAACSLKLLTVVLIHREVLITQWCKAMTDNSDLRVWVVGKRRPAQFDVIICMAQRVEKIEPVIRCQVGLLIIDEAKHLCVPSLVRSLLLWEPKYILLETATPTKSDGLHSMLYALAGTRTVKGIDVKPFTVFKVLTRVKGSSTDEEGNYSYSRLETSLLTDSDRDALIVDLAVQQSSQGKVLILTKRKDHPVTLCNLLREKDLTADYLADSKGKYKDSDILIGTTSKIGVGFDEANACEDYAGEPVSILILACSIKDLGALFQCVGRVFRSQEPKIYHLVDENHEIKSHWRICKKWYLENNGTVHEGKRILRAK